MPANLTLSVGTLYAFLLVLASETLYGRFRVFRPREALA